jgi:DNA-binding GntR family transcriptional regulator
LLTLSSLLSHYRYASIHHVPPARRPELPSARVQRELRAMLDQYEPGQQLPPVADLAARWNVGHGTIARTLAKLAGEGLVTVVPRYGAFKAELRGPGDQN